MLDSFSGKSGYSSNCDTGSNVCSSESLASLAGGVEQGVTNVSTKKDQNHTKNNILRLPSSSLSLAINSGLAR